MKYKLLKGLYDCFYTPPELQAQKQEIDECHQALSEVLGKTERRLVLQIIDAKDRIAEDTSIDSFSSIMSAQRGRSRRRRGEYSQNAHGDTLRPSAGLSDLQS